MIIGHNAYAPGLTVRWNDIGDDWASLFAPRLGCLLMIAKMSSWTVSTLIPVPHHRPEYARRCDAKRAAEVLVGQWWREKCERAALKARYTLAMNDGLTAAFKRMSETAREAAERFNVLTAKGSDLDRSAEAYGVEAKHQWDELNERMNAAPDESERPTTATFRGVVMVPFELVGNPKLRECGPESDE